MIVESERGVPLTHPAEIQMSLDAVCEHCNKRLKVPERLAGKPVKCPECGSRIEIPAAAKQPIAVTKQHRPKRAPGAAASKKVRRKKRSGPALGPTTIAAIAGFGLVAILGLILFLVTRLGLVSTRGKHQAAGQRPSAPPAEEAKYESHTTREWFQQFYKSQEGTGNFLAARKLRDAKNFIGPDPASLGVLFDVLAARFVENAPQYVNKRSIRLAESILKKFQAKETKAALATVSKGLTDAHPRVRLWAARLIGQLGEQATQDFLGPVAQLAREEDSKVAAEAAKTLGRMGPPAIPTLSVLLEDTPPIVKAAAAQGLAAMGAQASSAMGEMAAALKADDLFPSTRLTLIEGLGSIGPDAAAAAPMVVEQLAPNGS